MISASLILFGLLFAWFSYRAWMKEMKKDPTQQEINLVPCAYMGMFALCCIGGAIAYLIL